jgi:uncharacterized integral membrane protein
VKRLSWILTLPLLVVIVAFAIANLHRVDIELWPGWAPQVPLSWLLLGALFVGFLAGGLVAWLSAHKSRHRAREWRYKSTHLEREVIRLQREVARAKQKAAAAGPVPQTPGSESPSGEAPANEARALTAVAAGR